MDDRRISSDTVIEAASDAPSSSGRFALLVDAGTWVIRSVSPRLSQAVLGADGLVGLTLADAFPDVVDETLFEQFDRAVSDPEGMRFRIVSRGFPQLADKTWDALVLPLGTESSGPALAVILVGEVAGESAEGRPPNWQSPTGRTSGGMRLEDLAGIINTFPDGVLLVDDQGEPLYSNERMDQLLGLDRGELRSYSAERLTSLLDLRELEGKALRVAETPIGRALRGEMVRDEEFVCHGPAGLLHLSVCASPLSDGSGAPIGVVFVARDVGEWHIAQERLEQAITTERRRSSQMRLFNQLMMTLSSENDEGRLIDDVVHGAMRLTGALNGYVYLFDQGALRLEAFCSSARWLSAPVPAEIRGLVEQSCEEGRPLRTSLSGEEPAEFLAAPVPSTDGPALGCLLLAGTPGRAGFSADDETFVSNLAAHASVAFENLRRIAHEREVALHLQRSMLPSIVEVSGLEAEFSYMSATDAALVGGDFYDLIPLRDGRVACIVADVCGKGLEAATQTAKARYIFRAYATFGYGPGRWLQAVHEALEANVPGYDFVTAVLVLLNVSEGSVEYSLAGHPAPLVVGPNDVREFSGVPGLPLGAGSDVEYPTHHECLVRGETMFLFTDGLFEARRGAHLFGVERLPRAARRVAGGDVKSAVNQLIVEAREYAGGRLVDDVVVAALRRS